MAKRISTDRRPKARTAYLLTQAHYAIRARIDTALRAEGVTSLQYTVLSLVARHAAPSSAELSRRFYRTQQAMGQLLSSMEERGWITRSEDQGNRRILRVYLTAAGKGILAAGDREMDRIEDVVFGSFSREQIDNLRAVLIGIEATNAAADDSSDTSLP